MSIKKNILALAMISVLTGCGSGDDEIVRKRNKKAKDFRGLVSQYCLNSDKIKLSITEEIVELPCKHPQHIKIFPVVEEWDYRHSAYLEGSEPIPISSIQLMIESQDTLKGIWDVMPPLGVVLNVYSDSKSDYKHNCSKVNWCTHFIHIQGTEFGATLRFDADSTPAFSSYSGKSITKDEYPYAFYPETAWPELYEHTELFVKSLIQKN